jgi:threonine dehydratase
MTTQHMREPTLAGIHAAAAKIAKILPETPLLPLEVHGTTIWCKAEVLQPVGAFKIRGAWHRLSDLTPEETARGVVGVSSGNHAQGVAWAARRLGIPAIIVMPNDAPRVKLEATAAMGARIVTYDRPGGEDRDEAAAAVLAQTGGTLVHAYADPWVIEGQGTAGLALSAQMAQPDPLGAGGAPTRIVIPCGGGGLTAGIALACPQAEIIPVEPEGWDDVGRSLASGTIQKVGPDAPPTLCDALQTPATRPINFAILQARCAPALWVSPAEVAEAQRLVFRQLRLVVEPGGAAALAAVLAGKAPVDGRTAVMLTGGNTDAAAFAKVLAG